MNWYKQSQRENDTPKHKQFLTWREAQDYLGKKYNGHGRIETLTGEVITQCRCGGGETVLVPQEQLEVHYNDVDKIKKEVHQKMFESLKSENND